MLPVSNVIVRTVVEGQYTDNFAVHNCTNCTHQKLVICTGKESNLFCNAMNRRLKKHTFLNLINILSIR